MASEKPIDISQEEWDRYEADMAAFAAEDPGPTEEELLLMEQEYNASRFETRSDVEEVPWNGEDEDSFFDEVLMKEQKREQTLTGYVEAVRSEGSRWNSAAQRKATEIAAEKLERILAETEALQVHGAVPEGEAAWQTGDVDIHAPGMSADVSEDMQKEMMQELFSDLYNAQRILSTDESGMRGPARLNGSYGPARVVDSDMMNTLNGMGYEAYEKERFAEYLSDLRQKHGLPFDVKKEAEGMVSTEPEKAVAKPMEVTKKEPEESSEREVYNRLEPDDPWSYDESGPSGFGE